MNWRTGARIALVAIGLAVAVTVFVKSRSGPPPPKLPQDPPKLDPNVSVLGGPGRILSVSGNKPSLELTYQGFKSYDDGRSRFETALVKGLGDNAFTLRANVIETKGPAVAGGQLTQFTLSGGFTFESTDAMVVESDAASYDDTTGVMSIPGAVKFRRGRISGTSNGALYERDKDTTTLLDAASATVAPDAQGRGAAQASSKRMVMVRGQHSLQMQDGARISGESQVLSGRDATVVFSDDESVMKYLELTGTARVDPAPGAASGQPAMNADKLTMTFQPDGMTLQHATLTGNATLSTTDTAGTRLIHASWIDFFTGQDGRTVTQLKARDKVVVEIPATAKTSARSITAATLTASGDEKRGLTSARFDGNPCFQEAGASTEPGVSQAIDPSACSQAARTAARAKRAATSGQRRVGTATVLVLKLGGQLDAIQEAEFQQNAVFDDGRTVASADIAVYDDAKDVLKLRPNSREPRRQSTVETADMTVEAGTIEIFLETENLNAQTAVKTRTVRTAEKGKPAADSLFEGETPVYGTSESLEYVRETGRATYTGTAKTPASLKQGETEIRSARIDFTQNNNNLTASGQVDSTIVMTPQPNETKSARKSQKYRVQADTLTYDDARRVAVYEAPLVVLTTDDGNKTESRRLTLELAKETRSLNLLRAESDVFAVMSGGYEARGNLLVYRAEPDVYTISGRPAVVKSPPGENSSECKRTESTDIELNRKTGAVALTGRTPVPSLSGTMSCAESLRPIRK